MTMSLGINREASEARTADMRRSAGRYAIPLAEIKAAKRPSPHTPASMILNLRLMLDQYRGRRKAARAIVESEGAGSPSELLRT